MTTAEKTALESELAVVQSEIDCFVNPQFSRKNSRPPIAAMARRYEIRKLLGLARLPWDMPFSNARAKFQITREHYASLCAKHNTAPDFS